MMPRKIRLDPHALQVETFQPAAAGGEAGTVHAHDAASGQSCTYNCTLDELTCSGAACGTLPIRTCLC
jgi:hypothetical protein